MGPAGVRADAGIGGGFGASGGPGVGAIGSVSAGAGSASSVVGLVQVGITRAGPICGLGLVPSSQSTSLLLGTGPTVGKNSSGNHCPAPDSYPVGSAEVWMSTPPSPVPSTTHDPGAPRSNHPPTTRA